MFKNGLHLKITGTKAVLALNPLKRIPFFLMFFILLIGLVYSEPGAPRMWIPAVIAVLSLLGGLYTEKWIFNKSTDTVTAFRGLLFWGERSRFPLSSIREVRFTESGNEIRKKRSILFIFLHDGEMHNVDSAYGRAQCENLYKRAQLIADFCGRKLTIPKQHDVENTQLYAPRPYRQGPEHF